MTPTHKHWPSLVASGRISKSYDVRAPKFAIMRNPYSRFQSCFFYLSGLGKTQAENELRFLDEIEKCFGSIGDSHKLSVARPQSHWLLDDSGNVFVDKLFHVEDMAACENWLSWKLGRKITFDRQNVSTRFETNLTDKDKSTLIERINVLYSKDFELGGYEKLRKSVS